MFNKYPFTRGARTLATPSTSLLYTETTFSYFNRLLLGPVFTLENTPKIEVNIFMNCIVILKKMDSSFITRTFISNYAKRFEYFMLQDISNKAIREEILDYFDISTEYQRYEHDVVKMSVPYFLALVRGIQGFRLVDQSVNNGTVTLSNKQFVLILRTQLEDMLIKRVKTMGSVDGINIDLEMIETIKEKYKKYEPKILNVTNSGNIPPCVQFLISKIDSDHYLTHSERLLISTYMFSKGYDIEWLIDNIFKKLSDWNERITRYQLNYIKEHKVMNCDKVENQGMCRRELDSKNRCDKIQNPYNY